MKSKYLCFIWIFVFFIDNSQLSNLIIQTEKEIEEKEMVKTWDFIDASITLDTTKNGIRNIWFDGTYYWMADLTATAGYIYRYNADWSNKTTAYNTGGTFNVANSAVPCIRYINSAYHVIFSSYVVDTPAYYALADFHSTDGSTWSVTPIIVDDGMPPGTQYTKIGGVFLHGATLYYLVYDASDNYAAITDGTNWYHDTGRLGLITGGYSDGTDIYFLSYKAADNSYKIRKWNSVDGYRDDSTPIFDGGSSLDTNTAQLWKNGTSWVVAWANTVYYKDGSNDWRSITVTTAANPAPLWKLSSGTLIITGFVYADKLLLLNEKNYFFLQHISISHSCLFGWDNFICDTDKKIWELEKTALNSDVYCIPKTDTINYICVAQLYNYALDDEEGIFLYDDSDNLLFFGYADLDTIQSNNSAEVGLRLVSPLNTDLATTYSGTFTAGTAPETVISTILGTCKFCTAGTLSASGLTLAAAITYTNTPKSKIITDMLKIMARCVEINSALSISAKSTPTDSTKTLTFETITSSSGYNISELSKKKIKASNVKLRYGPSLTLYEQRGTAANEYEIQDLYPQITSATEIARIATQLLSTITPYYELVIDVWGNGKFTAGQSLVFSHTPESIPEETYYIVAENYNSTSGVAQIRIVNLIKYPIQNQIQQIQTQLDTVTTTANAALPSTTAASTYVALTGNQTVAGVKTFSDGIGSSIATTQAAGDNSTKVATTAFIHYTPIPPMNSHGRFGYTEIQQNGSAWTIACTDTDAEFVSSFYVSINAKYKIRWFTMCDTGQTVNQLVYITSQTNGGSQSFDIASAVALNTTYTANKQTFIDSAEYTIAANTYIGTILKRTTGGGTSGNFYVYGAIIYRTGNA